MRRAEFTADDDLCAFDDDYILSLGMTWRLQRALGEPYAETAAEYEAEMENKLVEDAGGARSFRIGDDRPGDDVVPLGGDAKPYEQEIAAPDQAAQTETPKPDRAKTPLKRPFTNRLKAVGIHPDGPMARDLSMAGITPSTVPGLFRRTGERDLDNFVASEWADIAHEIGEDENGYLARQGIVDALVDEHAGSPLQDRDQQDRQDAADSAAEYDRLVQNGIDPEQIDLQGESGPAASVIPSPALDISTPSERFTTVNDLVNAATEQMGLTKALRPAERARVIDLLDQYGGDVEDALYDTIVRSIDHAETAAEDQLGDVPWPEVRTDRQVPRDSSQGPQTDRGSVDQSEAEGGSSADTVDSEGNARRPTTRPAITDEQTEAGQQSVIPGAERDQTKSDAVRAAEQKAEADARGQQSKLRTGKPQKDAGPLFDEQGEMLDQAERGKTPRTTESLREAVANRTDKYVRPGDPVSVRFADDILHEPEAESLLRDIEAADTFEKRTAIADAWILEQGRSDGVEFLVLLDAQGDVLSVTRGGVDTDGTHRADVPPMGYRMAEAGAIGYATHNHPSSSNFSTPDVRMLLRGFETLAAIGHNGKSEHRASRGRASTDVNPHARVTDNAIRGLWHDIQNVIQKMIWDKKISIEDAGAAHSNVFAVVLDRLGVIEYSGDAVNPTPSTGLDQVSPLTYPAPTELASFAGRTDIRKPIFQFGLA